MKDRSITNHRNGAYLPGVIWTLIRTDFKTRYHGTLGGYLWALVKPLMMFVVLYTVFSVIFSMDPNYNLNLIIGLWRYEEIRQAGHTVLMVSHSPEDIERFCDRAILLEGGKVVQEGSGREIALAYARLLTSEKAS
jgi:hypothetical protein